MDRKILLDDPKPYKQFARERSLKNKQLTLMKIYLMEEADEWKIPAEEKLK
jgi:hypothetical protein